MHVLILIWTLAGAGTWMHTMAIEFDDKWSCENAMSWIGPPKPGIVLRASCLPKSGVGIAPIPKEQKQ